MKIFKNTKLILITILIISFVLRIYQINKVPVSLFGDEVDIGYQAYSILHTGRDYYGNFMPLNFHSLAEYRTPLYLYSAVPSIALFGISPLGVRLPAIIFGVLGVWSIYLLIKQLMNKESLALTAAFVLAFSPWHLQYSRAGFEVTELLFFLLMGLYLFFKSLNNGKWLWPSVVLLVLTPAIYSTAKLFTPILVLFLLIIWRKEIFKLPKKYLKYALIAGIIVGTPVLYGIVTTPQRFDYISVFGDPTIESEIGTLRGVDAKMRGETGTGLTPTLSDKLFENKFTFIGKRIIWHFLEPLSFNFFFNQGDPNLRQSIKGMGEFYKIEVIPLLVGIVLFFTKEKNRKTKIFIIFWIIAGILPAALTRDGGTHATRLILILPPFVFLIAYGVFEGINLINKNYRKLVAGLYILGFLACFVMYIHNYYVHYPWDSEVWWHAGYMEAIQDVKEIDHKFDKVFISTANEPPWVFFAGWYQYPPKDWQENFPLDHNVFVEGLGRVSHIDKFYFGSPQTGGVYDFGKVIDKDTLYLASAKEVNVNLIMEPERTPNDLNLIKAIAYPSGEPAFYLFTGK